MSHKKGILVKYSSILLVLICLSLNAEQPLSPKDIGENNSSNIASKENQLEQFLAQSKLEVAQPETQEKHLEDANRSSNHVDLLETVLQTLSTSHKVMASQEKMIQAKYNVDIAYGNYYPSIDASYSIAKTDLRPGIKKEDKTYEKAKYFGDELYSLTLSQNIYAGGETENDIERLKAQYLMSKADFEKLLEDEVLKAITSYTDVVFTRDSLDANKKNMEGLEAIYEIVKTKFDAGALSVGELSSIVASVSNAKSQLSRTQSRYTNALEYFKFVTDETFATLYPYEKIVYVKIKELNELIQDSFSKNSSLRAFNYEILSNQFNQKKLKAAFKPKVDLVLGAEKVTDKEDFDVIENSYVAKLKVSYNLYNGGKDQTQYLKAFSAIQEKTYEKEAEVRKVKWNLEKLYTSLTSLQSNLDNVENEVNASKRMVESYWESFRNGEQDLHVLLQGQRQLNTAELDWIKSQQDSMKDFFEILHLSGDLLHYFGIDVNEENYLDVAKKNHQNYRRNFHVKKDLPKEIPTSKVDNNSTQKENTKETIIKENNETTLGQILSFHERFLLESPNYFTIVISGLEDPLDGLKKISQLRIENNAFIYEFYEDQKIKTHIAHGIFKTFDEAERSMKGLASKNKVVQKYSIEKVGKVQNDVKEFSTLLFVNADEITKVASKENQKTKDSIINIEAPFATHALFKEKFLAAPQDYFTINVTTLSSIENAAKILNTPLLVENSFVFSYGKNLEWVKVMVGVYSSYEEAKNAIKILGPLESKYRPIIEKIGHKQELYKRFHSQ